MSDFDNYTPFAADVRPSADRDGRDLILIVIAASYSIPEPLNLSGVPLPLPEQPPVQMADVYDGDPTSSVLLIEGQSAYTRPATDITLVGEAMAAGGRAVRFVDVQVNVGPCKQQARVFGDRVWQKSEVHGATPSQAQPFVRLPLSWRRAYGGIDPESSEDDARWLLDNPAGVGYAVSAKDVRELKVPNIEDPEVLLNSIYDRPKPVGFTAVARSWPSRLAYAGTYDEQWVRERAPFWAQDFDETFFCAAVPELQARPHMRGGEHVRLTGLHPDGALNFDLPQLQFSLCSRFVDREVRSQPVLDAVVLHTSALYFTLYYRAAVPAHDGLIHHRKTMLRLLDSWEQSS